MSGNSSAATRALDQAGALEAPDWPVWLRTRHAFFRARFDRETDNATTPLATLNAALIELETAGEGVGRWAFLIRTELALNALCRGHTEEAILGLRALVELGRTQRQDSVSMGPVLASLMLALAELESVDDASEVATESAQQLKRSGLWPRFGTNFAFLAAKRGHAESAARMIGAVDAHLARSGSHATPALQRARTGTLSLIATTHPLAQVQTWISEGALLEGDAFTRLAIEATH